MFGAGTVAALATTCRRTGGLSSAARYMGDSLFAVAETGERRHGFKISSYDPEEPYARTFIHAMSAALRLIAQHDPRRYKTVVRQLKVIHCDPRLTTASALYVRLFRLCVIGHGDYFKTAGTNEKRDVTQLEAIFFAVMLIHEATHGRIDSFFIPYSSDRRERIERLCAKEEYRFLKRLEKRGFVVDALYTDRHL